MPEWVSVASVEDLPPGTARPVEVGERTVALVNVEGEIHACEGACPHLGGPLGDGVVNGSVLSCPWHGWQFDVTTGLNEFDRAIAIERLEVRVEDGEIQVAV